jgi:hypothetical protein
MRISGRVNAAGIKGWVVNFREVSDRKRLEDELRHQARTDPLTGLLNRAAFSERLAAATASVDPAAPPAVLDLVPFWRPVEWAAAVVVVDALAWGGVDPGITTRWSHLVEWPQVLLHALLFRLAVHAQHPSCTRESLHGLEHAARLVSSLLPL